MKNRPFAGGGYHLPPRWTDDDRVGAPPPAPIPQMPPQPRIEQVQVTFPVAGALEFQWVFHDGTLSPWRPTDHGIVKAPPGARGMNWRPVASTNPVKTGPKVPD